jgi:predicted AAA+ superfamily ATPase
VYQHLTRMGYEVKVGELRVGEIDFVCTKPNDTRYVQVAYLIENDETRQRECGRLRNIRNDYPKYVISMTPLLTQRDDNGITHLNLRKFLLSDKL